MTPAALYDTTRAREAALTVGGIRRDTGRRIRARARRRAVVAAAAAAGRGLVAAAAWCRSAIARRAGR